MLNILNGSSYVLPFNSMAKINELKVSIKKGYCNKFQVGKCAFGDKCRYRHEIDPGYKKKEKVVVGKNNKDNNKDKNKNKDKIMVENQVKKDLNYVHPVALYHTSTFILTYV